MNIFLTSMAILLIFVLTGIIWIFKKRKLDLLHYACKQQCEYYHFEYFSNSLQTCKIKGYQYQFSYQDKSCKRTGYIIIKKNQIKEIIFDTRSLDPRQNNPLFKSANEINNVIPFPKRK